MYRQNYPDDPGMHNRTMYPSSLSRPPLRGHHGYQPPLTFVQAVRRSFLTVGIGFFLICVSIGLVFWNEGRAVQTHQSLVEGLRLIHSLDSTDAIQDEHSDELIHISGPLSTAKLLTDDEYGVKIHAVKLKRHVEMYQWIEKERNADSQEEGQSSTYSYDTVWSATLIDSGSFATRMGHENPATMPESKVHVAEEVKVGNFYLSRNLIDQVTDFKSIRLTEDPSQSYIVHDGMAYLGLHPGNPKVGDIRIKFEYAGVSGLSSYKTGPPVVVSVIGKQDGDTIRGYITQAQDTLQILYMGYFSAQIMFGREQANNALLTWALRFVGWLLAFIGFGCWTSIITTLVDWLPIVRDLVGLGVRLMDVTLAISLTLTVIALGWLWYRPVWGIGMIFLASLPLVILRLRRTSTSTRTDRVW